MGIKFRCQACNKKLHVKAFLAGKKGLCPKCGGKIQIPDSDANQEQGAAAPVSPAQLAADRPAQAESAQKRAGAPRSAALNAVPVIAEGRTSVRGSASGATADPIDEAPNAVWYVRPPTGGQFGPADASIMRRWLGEGRVSAEALVWREGWPDWKPAGPLFPFLLPNPAPVSTSTSLLPSDGATRDHGSAVTERKGVAKLGAKRSPYARSSHTVRNVLMMIALGLLCVVLFVFLFIILRGQS
jgi:phage FluMu protein Com